ncbi:hypothetical protein JST97_35995 [bacterium]|nr:hypothetical protein [bacterium]
MGLPVQLNQNLHIQLSQPAQQGKEARGKKRLDHLMGQHAPGHELRGERVPNQDLVDRSQVKTDRPQLYWQGPGKPLTSTRPDPQSSANATSMMKNIARAVASAASQAQH